MRLEADAKVAEAAYGRDERGDREEQRDAGEADERLLDEVIVAVGVLEDPEDLVREVADRLQLQSGRPIKTYDNHEHHERDRHGLAFPSDREEAEDEDEAGDGDRRQGQVALDVVLRQHEQDELQRERQQDEVVDCAVSRLRESRGAHFRQLTKIWYAK